MRYFYAIGAYYQKSLALNINVSAGVVEAASKDEALGKAYRMARQLYCDPKWSIVTVGVVAPDATPNDPDRAPLTPVPVE
jgi:hypothetical protein